MAKTPRETSAVLLFLFFLPYVSGQGGNRTPYYNHERGLPPFGLAVIMISVFFSIFIICMCYRFFCLSSPPDTTEDRESRGRGRMRGRGIDEETVKMFPSFVYSEVKDHKIGKGGVECAVCLNGFEDSETLRLMPPCSHVFHADCIDVWLSSRSTCPVCRANLKPEPGESFSNTFVGPDTNHGTDPEMGNSGRVLEAPETRLIDAESRPHRSRSTELSSWRISQMSIPRSNSTGHSMVQVGENLDRFTLQLPDEVRRNLGRLNQTRSREAFPQARSSRHGFRSGSVGSISSYGRQSNGRMFSLSFSFSFGTPSSAYLSPGRSDHAAAAPKDIPRSIKSPFLGKEKDSAEGSFERLRPDGQV